MKHSSFLKGALSLFVAACFAAQPLTAAASDSTLVSEIKIEGTIAPEFGNEESSASVVSSYTGGYSLKQAASDLFSSLSVKKKAGSVCTSIDETAAALRSEMMNRNPSISVNVDFRADSSNLQELGMMIYSRAIQHTGNPKEGDYLKFQFGGGNFSGSFKVVGQNVSGTFRFNFSYYTDLTMEQAMDAEVDRVLASLSLNGKSDYEKVSAIYDYLTSNTSYDYAHVNDSSYLRQFTGYAALVEHVAVCQGYSIAFYRLALTSGLDARVIAGIGYSGSASGPHGWNIVRVGSLYYSLDSTWDTVGTSYRYFLKGIGAFDSTHVRDTEYNTAAFNASYPMSGSDFDFAAAEAERRAAEEAAAREAAEREAALAAQNEIYSSVAGFLDVSPTSYYANAVDWARVRNVTLGIDDNYFEPDVVCTRALTASLIWCAKGRPGVGVSTRFLDIPTYIYYAEPVNWAFLSGVTAGTSDITFSPDLGCTRAQVVTFLWRAEGSPEPVNMSAYFSDVAPDAYYRKAVYWALENGITAGTSPTTFSPDQTCTRAQIITFLYKDFT